MLFKAVSCILCVLYTYGFLWACFVFLGTKKVSVREFVGGAMQPTVPEDRLAGIALMGPVGLPSKRGYSSISDIRTINDFIVLC